jgi:hypothetical protein
MHQPHIQSEEIDLLLDGDEGFAVFPLRKHLAECPDCQARLERARAVNRLLESVPHVAPRPDFANAVMSRVQVFEPWYVSLADSVRQLVPRTGPWRIAAGLAAGGVAVSLSALAIWVSLRLDLAVYAVQLGGSRLQAATVGIVSSAVSGMFGEQALSIVRDGGTPALVIAVTVFFASLAGATFAFRGLLAAARRRGN